MRTQASFRLIGDAEHPAVRVTERLGVHPSRAFEAGTLVSSRSLTRRESSGWFLESAPGPEDGVELAVQLHRLLEVLEPLAGTLWELVEDGYWANWFCYLGSHASEHAAELDRDTLRRLLALPGDLWLDAYHDENDAQNMKRATPAGSR
jgi:hypothetical protein